MRPSSPSRPAQEDTACNKGAAGCPAEFRPIFDRFTAAEKSVLRLVDKLVLADPGHHRTQFRADVLDWMSVRASAHRLERGLIDFVLQHPVARKFPRLNVLKD